MTMKSFYVLVTLIFVLTAVSSAQIWQRTSLGIKTAIQGVNTEVQFYTASTVRILKFPACQSFTKESLSVTKEPQKNTFTAKQQGELLTLGTEKLLVQLNLNSGAINYYTKAGVLLLKEKEDGSRLTPFDDAGDSTFSVLQSFILDRDEAIYGLGQQQSGRMVQRNLRLRMVQGNTDDYIPFFQSVKGYGSFPGMLTDRKFNIILVSASRGGGHNTIADPNAMVNYSGKRLTVKL